MNRAQITGIGAHVPAREIPNSYFKETLGEDVDAWLRENVNITKRYWCNDDESVADLCEVAAKKALVDAGKQPEDIDLLVISTDTPEYISPSTASVIQDRLGLKNAGTFDLNTACAGFVTAMDVAAKYISSDDRYQNILVIGGYAMSKYLNHQDKKTVTLFADGAGAVVMSAQNGSSGWLTSDLQTKGEYNGWMGIYAGATNQPTTAEVLANHDHQLKFVHKFPKELNPKMWTEMALDICKRLGKQPDDFDHFFITQLNFNSINETMDNLGVCREKAHMVMDQYGYTGSACIPMALEDAYKNKKLKKGDLLMFIGSGGGLAFAAAAVQY